MAAILSRPQCVKTPAYKAKYRIKEGNINDMTHSNHYMIITPRNKRVNDIDIKIDGTRIQQVYLTKFLGVQIDAHLTWNYHVDYTCSKL